MERFGTLTENKQKRSKTRKPSLEMAALTTLAKKIPPGTMNFDL